MSKRQAVKSTSITPALEVPHLTATAVRAGIDIRATVDSIGQAWRTLATGTESLMWEAALATHAVVLADAIGADSEESPRMWATQGDYADALGVSKGYVTRLKLLGRAAVVHGVRQGSADWRWLSRGGNTSKVSKVINGDDTAAVREAVEEARAEDERKALMSREERRAEAQRTTAVERDETESEESRPAAPRTAGDALALLVEVESILRSLEDGPAEKVRTRLAKVAADDSKRREVLASTVTGEVVAG